MTTGVVSQGVSGAAQGAAIGSMFGPWGTVAGGVLGGIAGIFSGSSQDAQSANQMAWNRYNATMQLHTDMYNIEAGKDIAQLNAILAAGSGGIQIKAIQQNALYNATMLYYTVAYNDDLMEQELSRVWQDADLELEQLEQFRARERGTMVAERSASGTTLGEGSNADLVISQKTQEALDATIVRFNADRQAATIQNQRAQSNWQGRVAIDQAIWEGNMQASVVSANSRIQAGSILATNRIQSRAAMYTASQRYHSAQMGMQLDSQSYSLGNQQALVGGLFNAAALGVQTHYAKKVPTVPNQTQAPEPPPLLRAPNYSAPGTSLLGS